MITYLNFLNEYTNNNNNNYNIGIIFWALQTLLY